MIDAWETAKMIFGEEISSEEDCFELIYKIRYPKGYFCENCKKIVLYTKIRRTYSEKQDSKRELLIFQCHECHHQTSIISNTIFHKTRIPIIMWFIAIIFFVPYKKKARINPILKYIDVSYSTAWKMKKDIIKGIKKKNPFCDLSNYPLSIEIQKELKKMKNKK
jgi:hypothetical protein